MKRICCLILLSVLLLTGCDRAATRTSWSPINAEENGTIEATLPATLAAASTPLPTAAATATITATIAATATATVVPIGTLDVSTLPAKLPASAKGYELYSWQTDNKWNYTLITGTNRTKSFDEIIAPANSVGSDGFIKISVRGEADLKQVLSLLPRGEYITWGGWEIVDEMQPGVIYLTFPPQSIMDNVAAFCTAQHLNLSSLKKK
jgi:hypothetical protein